MEHVNMVSRARPVPLGAHVSIDPLLDVFSLFGTVLLYPITFALTFLGYIKDFSDEAMP